MAQILIYIIVAMIMFAVISKQVTVPDGQFVVGFITTLFMAILWPVTFVLTFIMSLYYCWKEWMKRKEDGE